MPADSAANGYDPVTRIIHWLAAFVILSNVMLGLSMTSIAPTDEAAVAETVRLFSIHKTLGLLSLAVALARILWALTRARRPGPLHPDRRWETLLAATVHWSLYGAMLVMPLSGWLYHAASPPYAPILWPFGQGLPGIPASPVLAAVFGEIHRLSAWVLYAAVGLHLAGVFRHAIFDMDATVARMTSGLGPATRPETRHLVAAATAAAIWTGAVAAGILTAPEPEADPFADVDAGAFDEAPAP